MWIRSRWVRPPPRTICRDVSGAHGKLALESRVACGAEPDRQCGI